MLADWAHAVQLVVMKEEHATQAEVSIKAQPQQMSPLGSQAVSTLSRPDPILQDALHDFACILRKGIDQGPKPSSTGRAVQYPSVKKVHQVGMDNSPSQAHFTSWVVLRVEHSSLLCSVNLA